MGGCASKPKDLEDKEVAPAPIENPEKAEEKATEVKAEEPLVDLSEPEAPKVEEENKATEAVVEALVEAPKEEEKKEVVAVVEEPKTVEEPKVVEEPKTAEKVPEAEKKVEAEEEKKVEATAKPEIVEAAAAAPKSQDN